MYYMLYIANTSLDRPAIKHKLLILQLQYTRRTFLFEKLEHDIVVVFTQKLNEKKMELCFYFYNQKHNIFSFFST